MPKDFIVIIAINQEIEHTCLFVIPHDISMDFDTNVTTKQVAILQ